VATVDVPRGQEVWARRGENGIGASCSEDRGGVSSSFIDRGWQEASRPWRSRSASDGGFEVFPCHEGEAMR
jgi:hypothetical protein